MADYTIMSNIFRILREFKEQICEFYAATESNPNVGEFEVCQTVKHT